jgi:uncharacterized glyoxalase superfamily protein PhnB
MSKASVKTVPDGFHSLTPHLICSDSAAAIDFYKRAFGAEEIMRMPGPDGKLMHASVRIGDSILMLADEMPKWGALGPTSLNGSPVTIHLAVADVDAVFARAIAAGAKPTMPVADMFWGDRYGKLKDPFGHDWAVATHIKDMTHDEMIAAGAAAMKAMSNCSEAGTPAAK